MPRIDKPHQVISSAPHRLLAFPEKEATPLKEEQVITLYGGQPSVYYVDSSTKVTFEDSKSQLLSTLESVLKNVGLSSPKHGSAEQTSAHPLQQLYTNIHDHLSMEHSSRGDKAIVLNAMKKQIEALCLQKPSLMSLKKRLTEDHDLTMDECFQGAYSNVVTLVGRINQPIGSLLQRVSIARKSAFIHLLRCYLHEHSINYHKGNEVHEVNRRLNHVVAKFTGLSPIPDDYAGRAPSAEEEQAIIGYLSRQDITGAILNEVASTLPIATTYNAEELNTLVHLSNGAWSLDQLTRLYSSSEGLLEDPPVPLTPERINRAQRLIAYTLLAHGDFLSRKSYHRYKGKKHTYLMTLDDIYIENEDTGEYGTLQPIKASEATDPDVIAELDIALSGIAVNASCLHCLPEETIHSLSCDPLCKISSLLAKKASLNDTSVQLITNDHREMIRDGITNHRYKSILECILEGEHINVLRNMPVDILDTAPYQTIAQAINFLFEHQQITQGRRYYETFCTSDPFSALVHAAQHGLTHLFQYTLQCVLGSGSQVSTVFTLPFDYACKNGHTDIAEYLLETSTHHPTLVTVESLLLSHEGSNAPTTFLASCRANQRTVVQLFFKWARQIEESDKIRRSLLLASETSSTASGALTMACKEGFTALAALLLEEAKGLDDGNTLKCMLFPIQADAPLYLACTAGHAETTRTMMTAIESLDEAVATADEKEQCYISALVTSCEEGQHQCAILLLEALHRLSSEALQRALLPEEHNDSPLLIACRKKDTRMASLLLDKAESLNDSSRSLHHMLVFKHSSPPLAIATFLNDRPTTQLLLERATHTPTPDETQHDMLTGGGEHSPFNIACQDDRTELIHDFLTTAKALTSSEGSDEHPTLKQLLLIIDEDGRNVCVPLLFAMNKESTATIGLILSTLNELFPNEFSDVIKTPAFIGFFHTLYEKKAHEAIAIIFQHVHDINGESDAVAFLLIDTWKKLDWRVHPLFDSNIEIRQQTFSLAQKLPAGIVETFKKIFELTAETTVDRYSELLTHACTHHCKEVVELLFEVTSKAPEQQAMMLACPHEKHSFSVAQAFVCACHNGHLDIVLLLIAQAKRLDPSKTLLRNMLLGTDSPNGFRPSQALSAACEKNCIPVIARLLHEATTVDEKDTLQNMLIISIENGKKLPQALCFACENGQHHAMWLIFSYANTSGCLHQLFFDKQSASPPEKLLELACKRQNIKAVRLLIKMAFRQHSATAQLRAMITPHILQTVTIVIRDLSLTRLILTSAMLIDKESEEKYYTIRHILSSMGTHLHRLYDIGEFDIILVLLTQAEELSDAHTLLDKMVLNPSMQNWLHYAVKNPGEHTGKAIETLLRFSSCYPVVLLKPLFIGSSEQGSNLLHLTCHCEREDIKKTIADHLVALIYKGFLSPTMCSKPLIHSIKQLIIVSVKNKSPEQKKSIEITQQADGRLTIPPALARFVDFKRSSTPLLLTRTRKALQEQKTDHTLS